MDVVYFLFCIKTFGYCEINWNVKMGNLFMWTEIYILLITIPVWKTSFLSSCNHWVYWNGKCLPIRKLYII